MTYLEDYFPSMTDIIADSLYYYVKLVMHTAYIRFHIICYLKRKRANTWLNLSMYTQKLKLKIVVQN
ncbi:hypothetical protein ACN38_g11732 [Penicillium nordicum]|uniref:Uncharacterized protein n=1 Tax=Penicillium nordicum TaxID=229535 RepID=A0A0M8NZD5_9EURO|nr:hypothetical protein ACN38_g11732 [Penicillium nordicum]